MKAFLLALGLIGLGVFGMCFNIIFRKDGQFPEYEVGHNKKMRQMGIKCMNELEKEGKIDKQTKLKCDGSCSNCGETECR